MTWVQHQAKNGEMTLKYNDIFLYSNYRPREAAWKWVESEFDSTHSCYLLIGLGLGYYAEKLIELAGNKPVYVYYFEDYELQHCPIPQAVKKINHIDLMNCQVLIPTTVLKAFEHHPIITILQDIKINQTTYKKFASIMERNFKANSELYENRALPTIQKKKACLVSSGPSFNETHNWLLEQQDKVDIYAVGSALKLCLQKGLTVKGVVISDPKQDIVAQLQNSGFTGDLYYLSTVAPTVIEQHIGPKYMLCQQGYPLAEQFAKEHNLPIIEVGGSVATVGFSLIELLGYETVLLFGQDFGFSNNQTHAVGSTSGRNIDRNQLLQKVVANSGEMIQIVPNLQTYLRWFNEKMKRTKLHVYNTAWNGAKIEGVQCLTKEQFLQLVNE